ncbi:MAG: hypothetical protein ACOYOU_15910 [Kiritimatiellia bacterium]
MTYIGWDGTGYQTGLASSDNLLNWNKERLLLGRGPKGSATEYNVALTCLLRDHELFGPGTLKRVNGRFVGTYHAYPHPGYEVGPAAIGLCYSDDLQAWDICPPVLFPEPSCAWERFSGNPVLRLGAKGDFDDIFASDPCVCARKRQTAGRNQPR